MPHRKPEPRIDFLQCLDDVDIRIHIMSLLDDPADLVRASAVSRFLVIIANGLAKQACLNSCPQLSGIAVVIGNVGTMTSSAEGETSAAMELDKDHTVYASILEAIRKLSSNECLKLYSMHPRDSFLGRPSSSKGQSDPKVPEMLTCKLKNSIWVITEIHFHPYFYQRGSPIYSAKSVRYRIGHPDHDDNKFVWTYTSPEHPMMQEVFDLKLKLPEPVLFMGGYLQIEFLDRVQASKGTWSIRTCHAQGRGRPLFPAFDLEVIEPKGKMLLRYHPEFLSSIMGAKLFQVPTLKSQVQDL
ncbi:hypothetical protein OROMI_006260 [Orobanche minor]